jgi:TP901 family phage tail tape measure protein
MATVSTTIELVDKISSQLNSIKSNVSDLEDALKGVGNQQDTIDKFSWSTFLKNAEEAGKKMESIGKSMSLAITAPLTLLGKKMYGNAVDYESAYVGMTKTVEGTEEQYAALNETVQQLSESTPMGYVDLMGIAQTGGNLGVAIDEMDNFVSAYARLQYATDQHISGESGAQDVASFLNITEGGVANIDRFGSALVHLGNNFNATEDQIIGMGNRMASAGHLAGLETAEILGMATAFRSVGINPEAGGSAASKLIKQFQLSAEVGGQAQKLLDSVGMQFGNGMEFSNFLAGLKKDDMVGIAESLNMTTDAVQSMADSWVLMDQFSAVSGKTAQQFIDDWSKDPAQAMGDFFTGLSQLGDNGADSILATLDRMGLTEIRESNLIAAMASRPELFMSAIQSAIAAYSSNTAMTDEFSKQMETQQAQNAMLGNKLDNTMANFGDNLVTALQPALDLVNNLLDAFNSLSEVDQTNVVKALGALAITGPTLTALGKTVDLVSKLAQNIEKIHNLGGAKTAVDAANAAGAGAGATGATGAAVGGSALLGAAGIGVIGAGFYAAAQERLNNENIRGSVNAIVEATNQNADLQQAFVNYVTANQELQTAIGQGDLSNTALFEQVNQAQATFESFDGYQKVLDAYSAWRQENSLGNMDWTMPADLTSLFSQSMNTSGADVAQGLADGITGNTGTAASAATTMGQSTIDAANAGLGVNSPSVFMIQSGMDTMQGLAMGITSGGGAAIAAISAIASQVISIANSIMGNSAGYSIGANLAAGMAAGIRSGAGAVAAAVRSMVTSAIAAGNAAAQIHSPSRLTDWSGSMLVQGYVDSIEDGHESMNRAISGLVHASESSWNREVWDNIASFTDLENQKMREGKKSKIKLSDSDMTKIRDLAEREVINRFTTAELHVDFTANNQINSDLDLDGVVTYLSDKVAEQLEIAAEGVH